MSATQIFLSHADGDDRQADEVRAIIESGMPVSVACGRDLHSESELLLLLCGPESGGCDSLRADLEQAKSAGIPVIPIVHGGQELEAIALPVAIHRGVEVHDQMFAIKLLIAVREALSGETPPTKPGRPRRAR